MANICDVGEYGSEFEYDSEVEKKKRKRQDLAQPSTQTKVKLPEKNELTEEYCREINRQQRFHLLTLDAFSRHKKLINDYLLFYGGSRKDFNRDSSRDKTDYDVLRENHKFLWEDEDDTALEHSWEKRLAKKYYDKLFKEYCIGDLSRYKENKIALRWRTESEVVSGKGQFACGEKRCQETEQLRSWEVNFGYVEHKQKKNALVKIRLCPECSHKLNYHHRKREIKKRKTEMKNRTEDAKRAKADESSTTPEHDTSTAAETASTSDKQEKSSKGTEASEGSGNEEKDVWSQPVPITEEKPREDEFEEYFEDMFL